MSQTRSQRVGRLLCVVLFLGSALVAACSNDQPKSSSSTGPAAVTVDIPAAKGGVITNTRGATLTIPPGALSTDAHVTLADVGKAAQPSGDPLNYLTDGFSATAQPDAGNGPVALTAPLHLDLNGKAPANTQLLVIGAIEPDKAGIHIHAGDTSSNNQKLGLKYTALGNIDWIIRIPLLTQHPTEKLVLQVPWYDQNGLPWCAPTSLTENLRYYDFSETSDPLNATFGQSTALANWQLTGATHQAAGSGGWYDGATSMGVTLDNDYDSASGPRFVVYQWDADFFFASPGDDSTSAAQDVKFESFVTYVTLVNTGLFGLFDRKPLTMAVDAWWHSVEIVGVDGDGVYISDSNGGIANKTAWMALANSADTWVNDHGNPVRKHLIWTGVAYDLPIKPTAKREGSMVLVQGGVNFSDVHNNPVSLAWDGAAPHADGYYFQDATDPAAASTLLGEAGVRNKPLTYSYRVANVTDTALTFHAIAELADQNYSHIFGAQPTDVTVPPYAVSDPISGSFASLPTGDQGVFVVRLLERGSNTVNQDVKFVRFNIVSPPPPVAVAPTVAITLPQNNSQFTNVSPNGQPITLKATGSSNVVRYLWSDNLQGNLGDSATVQANLTIPQYGNCALATHVITVTAYNQTGQSATDTITVTLQATCIK